MAARKLVLDTKGLCFWCFSQVTTLDPNSQMVSNKAFKELLRYLQITVCELESLEDSVYSSVDNKNVMLSLCMECDAKTAAFSKMYTAWEEMGRKMNMVVGDIHNQMVIGDTDPVKIGECSKKMKGSAKWREVFCENVVDELRKEAIHKCFSLIKSGNVRNCLSYSTACSLTGNQTPNFPFEDNQVQNNDQSSTSKGSILPEDLLAHEQGPLQLEFVEGEVDGKVEFVTTSLGNHLERADDEKSINPDDDIVTEEVSLNLLQNEKGIPDVVIHFPVKVPDQVHEFVGEANQDNIAALTPADEVGAKTYENFEHIKTKSGGKTQTSQDRKGHYKCVICDRVFRHESQRRTHLKTHQFAISGTILSSWNQ